MPRCKVHDGELHFLDEGRGVPLLLVHGFPLDHTMWRGQIAEFSKNCRVLAPDLRGFGQSSVLPGLVTMQRIADDVAELIRELKLNEPVIFCGLSMGGYVGWQFVLRHRELVARLIQCDTRAIADSSEAATGRQTMAERVQREGPGFIAESMLPKLFAPETIAAKSPVVDETRQVILRTNPQGIAAACRGMAQRPDVTPLLAQFDLPALLIGGEHDAISPPQEMKGIAAQMPQATFVEIAGAGHMSPLEKPDQVNDAMRRFIAG